MGLTTENTETTEDGWGTTGGTQSSRRLDMLEPGERVWVNVPGEGYVGVGRVTQESVPVTEFTVEQDLGAHQTPAEAAKRVPKGIICLLSALRFHEIGTQSPHQVWMAIDRKAAVPKIEALPIRIVRFSGSALSEGIEKRDIGGARIKVYCPAKTVADCFKYRNKIGLDVALGALQDSWQQNKVTADELWKCARISRVANVMRPYMETIT